MLNDILTFFGGTVIGGVIGYFIKHFLDLRYYKKLEEMNKKRKIYEDAIDSLNIFISGRNADETLKNKFLETYARLWLWASDSVIEVIGKHLEYQVKIQKNNNDIDQEILKESFASCVLEMRKDLGYPKSKLNSSEYKFVRF